MTLPANRKVPPLLVLVYALLDPIPYGFFVAALIFDIVYQKTAEILWVKSAAWLLAIGLVIAIVPRIINLLVSWMPRYSASGGVRFDFLCTGIGMVVAIINAFVHSRDAYAVMPTGVWLSLVTVVLMAVGRISGSLGNLKGGINDD